MAYHAMAAAMHCAMDLRDKEGLGEVQALAAEQLAWLDAEVPDHPLATRSSETRGTGNLWHILEHQAQISRTLVEHQRRLTLS